LSSPFGGFAFILLPVFSNSSNAVFHCPEL
jgi:hypothetical protein